ncbi:YceI family protein [Nisaea acidiphila]|uniref:YceI family protein n=1 Tax=Nisaea acidiphila TaxID=1862145 RepID=A0A9J7AZ37_9PROT|nr:YceI family protein [Nisaea acidiphila]UUX51697.1 YceI family protein [Nisaea acidiphila]
MKRILTAFALAVLALTAVPATAETYVIDTKGAHASITFRASHLGFSWLTGRFDSFTGQFEFDEANPDAATVSVEIDVNSLNSNHAERDNHLRSDDFFDAASHPKATFVSKTIKLTGDKTAVITGDLTIRGVTKTVDIEASHVGGGKDPWGGFRQGFSGTATIVPADFGMPNPIAKTPVELVLEVEGIRQ